MQTVFLQKDIKCSLDNVLNCIQDYSKNSNTNARLQNLQKIKFEKRQDNSVFSIFYNHLVKSELLSAGSSDIFIDQLIDTCGVTHKVSAAQSLKFTNLKELIKTFADDDISQLIFEALNLAGLKGKVVLSNLDTNLDKNVLEFNTGSFFSDVQSVLDVKSTKYMHAKIACIDGYIENVSEIHRLLEDAAASKETLIIFLRGLSEDVRHTLKVNYDRGTLSVIPIITKFDIDNSNLLNDIAVVSGVDVYSNLKGDLFSSIDISSIPRVDSIDVSSSGVLIENQCTNAAIDRHISFLQKKILDSDNQTAIDVITKRLQRLGTNRVTIKLANTREKAKKFFMIDRSLRAVKAASSYGISTYKGNLYPNSSLTVGKIFAEKFYKSINDLGAILV